VFITIGPTMHPALLIALGHLLMEDADELKFSFEIVARKQE
jgi:hypothetical protein